jgi:hypothetical protein
MGNVNRITKAGNDQKVVKALRENLLSFNQLPLGGKMYTQAEAADFIDSRALAVLAVQQAKAAWIAAIAAFKKLDAEVDIVERDLRNLVIGACGEESQTVKTFGFAPRKKPVLTPDQKTAANLKRAATRKKRGTMGRKQRLKVKGEVPAAATAAATTETNETTTTETNETMAGVGVQGAATGAAGTGSTGSGRGESGGASG